MLFAATLHYEDLIVLTMVFLLIPIIIAFSLLSFFGVVISVIYLKHRLWKIAVSVICSVLIIDFTLLSARQILFASEIINFYIIRSSLQDQVVSIPGALNTKLKVFTQGGFITMSYGFVFDGSDQIALPYGKQNLAWDMRAKKTELGCGPWTAVHITGHFYRYFSWC